MFTRVVFQRYRESVKGTEGAKPTSCPKYKLTYFNGRGRGEPIRLILAAGDIEYEDCRVAQDKWPELKKTTPFGSLPVLEIEGEMFGQSVAVGRLAANIAGLLGKDLFEQAEEDAIVDSLCDLRSEVFKVLFMKGDEQKTAVVKVIDEKCKPTLDRLSKSLKGDYLVGGKLSWADIWFYSVMEIFTKTLGQEGVMDGHTSMRNLFNRVRENKSIAKYLDNRPATEF